MWEKLFSPPSWHRRAGEGKGVALRKCACPRWRPGRPARRRSRGGRRGASGARLRGGAPQARRTGLRRHRGPKGGLLSEAPSQAARRLGDAPRAELAHADPGWPRAGADRIAGARRQADIAGLALPPYAPEIAGVGILGNAAVAVGKDILLGAAAIPTALVLQRRSRGGRGKDKAHEPHAAQSGESGKRLLHGHDLLPFAPDRRPRGRRPWRVHQWVSTPPVIGAR